MEIKNGGSISKDFSSHLNGVRERAMQFSRGGGASLAEKTASAKALRWAHVWYIQGTT